MSDAWRYAPNLTDPEAAKKLLQAALTAHATIVFAQTQVNPEQFGTVPDWNAVRRELREALKAAGHPAGEESPRFRHAYPAPDPQGGKAGHLHRPGAGTL